MERVLPRGAVVRDAQPHPRCSGLFNDPPAQRLGFSRLFLVLRIPCPLLSPSSRRSAKFIEKAGYKEAQMYRRAPSKGRTSSNT
jgi:hypothetical protein